MTNGSIDDLSGTVMLSDQVFAKLQLSASGEHKGEGNTHSFAQGFCEPSHIGLLDDKIIEVYSKVGLMLSRYRSGKIPKAFKILPKLQNWQQILELTKPETWTPNATYQATKVFISGLTPKLAEYFLTNILLPKVREDIAQSKKLSPHLYESLKKSIYKPEAFFKGIVLALCEEPDVTLKEATIVASIVAKLSIPVLHSAATLLKLSQGEYSGARSIFIKTLLDKRYALPLRVVSSMVEYFIKFKDSQERLPVLWHQGLLIFAQRYKKDLSEDQRRVLLELLSCQHHDMISAEIIRELQQAGSSEGASDVIMS